MFIRKILFKCFPSVILLLTRIYLSILIVLCDICVYLCKWYCIAFYQDSELVFNAFHIAFDDEECPYDFLSIYTPDGRRLYGPLCGNLVPEPIQFSGEVMVYFESDESERKPGFSAEYGPVGTVENPHGQ